jgi:hypothetical protein
MARCVTCNTIIVGGYRSGEDRYCSLPCFTASPLGNFCPECVDATTPDSPGGTFTFNTVGTRLFFADDRCPKCHSIVQRKAVCAFFLPVIPLSRYRVIYVSGGRYLGRRLRPNQPGHPWSSGKPIEPK